MGLYIPTLFFCIIRNDDIFMSPFLSWRGDIGNIYLVTIYKSQSALSSSKHGQKNSVP